MHDPRQRMNGHDFTALVAWYRARNVRCADLHDPAFAGLAHHIIAGGLVARNSHEHWPVLCSASMASVPASTECQNSSSEGRSDARPAAHKVVELKDLRLALRADSRPETKVIGS